MKKSLMLITTFAMALGIGVAVGAHRDAKEVKADSTRDLYFNIIDTDDFALGNERYAVYAFGSGEAWYDMTKYGGEGNFYKATVDSKYTSVIFCRMNKEAVENDWPNKWDQTDDLVLSNSTTYFKATAKVNDNISGEWYDASPAAETNLYYAYDANNSLGTTLENIKIHGFGAANTVLPSVWPGVHTGISSTTAGGKNVYRIELSTSYSKFILNNGTVQTADVADASDHVGDVLILGAADGEGHFTTSWQEYSEFVDFPAEDGYYLLGTESSWKFAGSTKIPSVTKDAHNNVAILSNYGGKLDEEIRVRSYKNGVKDWLDCVTTSLDGVGSKVADNFVFSSAAPVDIYVFDDNGTYKFSVAKHVELLTITVVNRYYIGSAFEKTDAAPSQDCVKGEQFDPIDQSTKDGYVARGYYTDEACTTKFVDNTVVNESTTLYSKYTKVGYYAISEAGNWSIDAAEAMQTTGIAESNKAEIHLSVLQNECYSFVEYTDNGTLDGAMDGQNGLGEGVPNTLAVYEDNHVKFVKDASVHVYFGNDDLIYLNEGLTAFLTNFISDVGGVCSTFEGPGYEEATYISNLQAAWARQKNLFNALDPETEQKVIIDAGYDAPVSEEALNQMIAKYRYIVDKYGTDICEDFIWKIDRSPKVGNSIPLLSNSTNTGLIIIISVSAISVISIAAFLMLKKRKEK